MRNTLGVLLVVSGYIVIYYRLLVRHFYQQQYQVKETTFAALFSFPPYGRLDAIGRKYAKRYWVAVAVMVGCLLALAFVTEFAAWKLFTGGSGLAAGSRGGALSETAAVAPKGIAFTAATCAHCRRSVRLGHWALAAGSRGGALSETAAVAPKVPSLIAATARDGGR